MSKREKSIFLRSYREENNNEQCVPRWITAGRCFMGGLMKYREQYFEDSVVDGFYVPSMMKKAWAAQLEVLSHIDRVCRKNGIRWWADCGTLLGAVRHGGYIPWDDDLDICMFRDDLQKFLEKAPAELPDGYDVQNVRTHKDYDNSIVTRVINKTTVYIDDKYMEEYHGFPFVAGVDIFVLDYVAPEPEDERKRLEITRIVSSAAAGINAENQNSQEVKELLARIEDMLNVKFTNDKPIDWQLRILKQDLYSMYTGNPKSGYVALMSYWMDCGNHKYPISCFSETAYLPFENMMMPVPACYNQVLSIEYGNYMKIRQSGGVHGYPFYTGMRKQLFELLQYTSPYDYKWDEADTVRTEGSNYSGLRGMLRKFLDDNDVLIGDADEKTIVKLQQMAITIGTALESTGTGNRTVSLLEEYCEELYGMYMVLSEGGDCSLAKLRIGHILDDIKAEYDNISRKHEIVFLVWKSSSWYSMMNFYEEAVSDPGNAVYVIPVPYYYRKADKTPGAMNCEGSMLPGCPAVTDSDEYDFELRHPDIIYTDYPYDDRNDYVTTEKRLYSSVLKNCCDRLVYISPFVTGEITDDNERAIYNMRYYVTMPAVVNADRVYVQSEQIKKMYVKVLSGWAGNDTKHIWEKKIMVAGMSAETETPDVPDAWKKLVKCSVEPKKPVVLFTFNISTFMENGMKAVDRLKKVIDTFEQRRNDVTLWWLDDSNIRETMSERHKDIWEKYSRIVEKYREAGFGIFDDSGDYKRAVGACDAYYGSPGMPAAKMKLMGKPVMIADVLCDS